MSEYDKDGDYYFIRGNALFIVLNSVTAQATDTHEAYVPKVIAEHPDTKWRILIQHYPAYSSVARYQEQMDSWMRYSLGYICEDNDIDLVLTGTIRYIPDPHSRIGVVRITRAMITRLAVWQ